MSYVKNFFRGIILFIIFFVFLRSTMFLFFNTNSNQMIDVAIRYGSTFMGSVLLSCTYVVVISIKELDGNNMKGEISMPYIKKIILSILVFFISHTIVYRMQNFFFGLGDVSYVKEICNAGTYLVSIIIACTYIIVVSIDEIKLN